MADLVGEDIFARSDLLLDSKTALQATHDGSDTHKPYGDDELRTTVYPLNGAPNLSSLYLRN